jgi:hypothetical protein
MGQQLRGKIDRIELLAFDHTKLCQRRLLLRVGLMALASQIRFPHRLMKLPPEACMLRNDELGEGFDLFGLCPLDRQLACSNFQGVGRLNVCLNAVAAVALRCAKIAVLRARRPRARIGWRSWQSVLIRSGCKTNFLIAGIRGLRQGLVMHRPDRCLRPISDLNFSQYSFDVHLHGSLSDAQLVGDDFVRSALN